MIVALDLETTWLDKDNDQIIEIALVKFDPKTFEIKEEYSTFVKPTIQIPNIVSTITNIKDEDLINSPSWSEISKTVLDFIWDFPILWHNIGFDISFLQKWWISLKNNICIDTFYLSNFLMLWEISLSLSSLSKSLGFSLENAHRALDDTKWAIYLFEHLISKMRSFSEVDKKIFSFVLSKSNNWGLEYIYEKILSYEISKKLNERELEVFIVDIISVYSRQTKKFFDDKLEIKKLEELVLENNFMELRQNQSKMFDIVSEALNKQKKSVIEAPTWVWKTLAYLIPSIFKSVKTGSQVYISTSTKALQDQIYYKDLAFLSKSLWFDFSFSKLKWRRNYLSLNAFYNFLLYETDFSDIKSSFVLKILFWLKKTELWELDELDYYGEEFSFIREINSDDNFVFSSENPFEKYEFILKARKAAKTSNIVIINNNILFQDISSDNSILWSIENLIIDEAHSLEDTITNSLKKSFSLQDYSRTVLNITRILKKHNIVLSSIFTSLDKLLFDLEALFEVMENYLKQNTLNSSYKTILITDKFYSHIDNWIDNLEFYKNIEFLIIDFIDSLSTLQDDVYKSISKEIFNLEYYLDILKITLDRVDKTKYIKILNFNTYWGLSVEYTLLNIGNYLNEKLWTNLSTCLLTSATLQIWNSFDYMESILKLDNFDFHSLESDFDYAKQSLLFIPNNLWNVKNNMVQIIDFLLQLFLLTWWKTLVLFTSFFSIKETYSKVFYDLKNKNINLYAQSIWWWKHKIINLYKENASNSILLWTDTFWEWIDIPWEDLKYLVIHKTPFMVPSDPIFQARSALFRDSFGEYSLPKAILKLKQWFWRLVRTKTDNWIVIFLDDRIYSTSWGEQLYKAFPKEIKIRIWKTEDFISILSSKNS